MLFKGKRPIGNLKFDSYEKCRQWARKLIRKKVPQSTVTTVDFTRLVWRTPSIGMYGYTIRKLSV